MKSFDVIEIDSANVNNDHNLSQEQKLLDVRRKKAVECLLHKREIFKIESLCDHSIEKLCLASRAGKIEML